MHEGQQSGCSKNRQLRALMRVGAECNARLICLLNASRAFSPMHRILSVPSPKLKGIYRKSVHDGFGNPLAPFLFDRYTLCQITWLIHIFASAIRYLVGQEL